MPQFLQSLNLDAFGLSKLGEKSVCLMETHCKPRLEEHLSQYLLVLLKRNVPIKERLEDSPYRYLNTLSNGSFTLKLTLSFNS